MNLLPSLSRNVIVRTAEKIGDQNEHAAIITRVCDNELIAVTLFPAGAEPRAIERVFHADSQHAGANTWRWPSGA
jgi:hypothetical protein